MAVLRSSVRAKLLTLVLAPLVLGVPMLLGLVWTWGSAAYQRLVTYKVGSDLVTAHEYFDRVRMGVGRDLEWIAGSHRMVAATHAGGTDALAALLRTQSVVHGVDFLHFLDRDGRVVASSSPFPEGVGAARKGWPVVDSAFGGAARAAISVFSAEELERMDPALRQRAHLTLRQTPAAAPDDRTEEARGMLIHAAVPVYDPKGFMVGVLEGGVLLNGNLSFVDRINAIVYREGSLPLGSRGTATVFLGDTRIATNVHLFGGQRALGTRVSRVVRSHVLEGGETWLGTAFVVNDDYVSGYEPIVDGRGDRVGMLYVGFLETPFRQAKYAAMGTLFGIFLLLSGLGAVLSLRWARGVFRPIERMNAVIRRVEQGEQQARVGDSGSQDELGRLAREFDRLLDSLAAKQAELQRWGEELDHKVMERTAALEATNETLGRAQQQLVLSEKLAAVGELTAGVAHEINNPVAVIQGNLDLLRDILGPAAAPVQEEIRLIHQQADRIRQIVTKLLQFARPGEYAGYVEPVDVNQVVADCLFLTRHNLKHRDIRVLHDYQATLGVQINRSELQQVLINLVVNAVQAMPDGGELRLATADWREDGALFGVCVTVRDNGVGISEHDLQRIFDPFFTTKKGSGTGLGLSISYALVQRYGGHIRVLSEAGVGAEFQVWLRSEPVFDDSPAAPGFEARWEQHG